MIVAIELVNPVENPLKIPEINQAIQTLVLELSDITGTQLRNLTIPAGKIADSAITTPKILDGAVTTVKIPDGAITEAKLQTAYKTALTALFNGKATKALDNVTLGAAVAADGAAKNGIAWVTSSWVASNGLTWYRKWSNGWIEQGGYKSGLTTITLPTAFTSANFTVNATWFQNLARTAVCESLIVMSKTTTTLVMDKMEYNGGAVLYTDFFWTAAGF